MPIVIKRRVCPTDNKSEALKSHAPVHIANLADVLASLQSTDLPECAHRDIKWAVNAFCAGLGVAPIDVPADARSIRDQLETLSPAMLRLQPASFNNIRSIMRRVLRLMGKTARRRARNEPLSTAWAALFARLETHAAKAGMGAFISFCSSEGYAPGDVGDEHLARFAKALEEGSFQASWRNTVKSAVREWNKAAETVAGWPSIQLRSPWACREIITLSMEALPLAYQGSIEEYLYYLENPPDDDFAPLHGLRPESIKSKRFGLRYMGSVLLRAGTPPEMLNAVDDLVVMEALDTILSFFEPAEDGSGRATCLQMAIHLKSIATSQKSPSKAALQKIQKVIQRCQPKTKSMTKRNRAMISRLSGERTIASLLTLPPRIFAALAKIDRPTTRDANLALTALYIEIALMWPGRVGNLSKIHLQDNIIRSGAGRGARMFLHFDAESVKNNKDLEVELPPETAHMVDLFIKRYRHLLIQAPSAYLFPHRNGGPRHRGVIWGSVTTITERYIGVAINPHLFRHLGVDLFLKAHPGNYEVARRTLAHSSVDTTTRHYAGAENHAAFRMYDENVLRLRDAAPEVLARGRHGRASSGAPKQPAARKRPATLISVSTKREGIK